jgi:hypothetical protein
MDIVRGRRARSGRAGCGSGRASGRGTPSTGNMRGVGATALLHRFRWRLRPIPGAFSPWREGGRRSVQHGRPCPVVEEVRSAGPWRGAMARKR